LSRLVVVTHEFDEFTRWRRWPWPAKHSPYTLFDILRHLETMGHSWQVTRGPTVVPGDAALLHVDCTVINEEYLALGSRYPRALNFRVADTSKRNVSKLLLQRGDPWDGRVIVKSDLNYRGILEDVHNRRAARAGKAPPHPGAARLGQYHVFEAVDDIDDGVWNDARLVVERFLPEVNADGGFVIRTWVFMGGKDSCNRIVTPNWIAKAGDAVRFDPIPVPEQLRAERERLNFDYGKFDFVMNGDEPLLLDANRTPGIAKAVERMQAAAAPVLAGGLSDLIQTAP
jgi:hypothetical protein